MLCDSGMQYSNESYFGRPKALEASLRSNMSVKIFVAETPEVVSTKLTNSDLDQHQLVEVVTRQGGGITCDNKRVQVSPVTTKRPGGICSCWQGKGGGGHGGREKGWFFINCWERRSSISNQTDVIFKKGKKYKYK